MSNDQGFSTRGAWWDRVSWRIGPAIAWMAVIFGLSSRSTLPQAPGLTPDATSIAGHLVAYGILAATCWWALGIVRLDRRRRFVLAFALAVGYGLTDEWHQSFVPGRNPDPFDILTDAVGAGLVPGGIAWWTRRTGKR